MMQLTMSISIKRENYSSTQKGFHLQADQLTKSINGMLPVIYFQIYYSIIIQPLIFDISQYYQASIAKHF